MAKIIYADTLVKDGTEGLNLTFDQERTVEAGQMLKAAVAWFELTTGRILIAGVEAPQQVEDAKVVAIKPAAKPGRKPRRTKAEMEAARGNGPEPAAKESDWEPQQTEDGEPATPPIQTAEIHEIGPASASNPTAEDVRFTAQDWLEKKGPEGPVIFKEMLVAQGANESGPKISDLTPDGLSGMMTLLMQAPADG